MLQPAYFIIVTTIAILALAIGVLVALLVTRRSVSDWQKHLTETTQEWKKHSEQGLDPDPVKPKRTSLQTVMEEEGREGSAYLRADELPKFDHRHDSAEG